MRRMTFKNMIIEQQQNNEYFWYDHALLSQKKYKHRWKRKDLNTLMFRC